MSSKKHPDTDSPFEANLHDLPEFNLPELMPNLDDLPEPNLDDLLKLDSGPVIELDQSPDIKLELPTELEWELAPLELDLEAQSAELDKLAREVLGEDYTEFQETSPSEDVQPSDVPPEKKNTGNHTEADVAKWMRKELKQREGELHQEDAVSAIRANFGTDFVYTNKNGNDSISLKVLSEFLKITPDVVWDRTDRYWRWRRPGDGPGRSV